MRPNCTEKYENYLPKVNPKVALNKQNYQYLSTWVSMSLPWLQQKQINSIWQITCTILDWHIYLHLDVIEQSALESAKSFILCSYPHTRKKLWIYLYPSIFFLLCSKIFLFSDSLSDLWGPISIFYLNMIELELDLGQIIYFRWLLIFISP